MNDLERQLQAVRLAAPAESLDCRMEAAFSATADSSEGGARCPQRASGHPPEWSSQRVEDNALHPRSPESDRARVPVSTRRPYHRVSLFALLGGLGAAAVAAVLILFATRPQAKSLVPPESVVVYRVEPTGLVRQSLTETPVSQRPLPQFTVQVSSPALSPATANSNPSS